MYSLHRFHFLIIYLVSFFSLFNLIKIKNEEGDVQNLDTYLLDNYKLNMVEVKSTVAKM